MEFNNKSSKTPRTPVQKVSQQDTGRLHFPEEKPMQPFLGQPKAHTTNSQQLFQTINAPILEGLGWQDCYTFQKKYKKYCQTIHQRNIDNETSIYIMSLKDCVEEETLRNIWMFELGLMDEDDLTQDHLEEWLLKKISDTNFINLELLEKQLKREIKMDSTISNMQEKVKKLLSDFTSFFYNNGVKSLYIEDDSSRAVKLLLEKLEPKQFQKAIKIELSLKKGIKTNWLKFAAYLIEEATYLDRAKLTFPTDPSPPTESKKSAQPTKPKSNSNTQKKKSNIPQCLNPQCSGQHLMRHCPNSTNAEKDFFLTQRRTKLESASVPNTKRTWQVKTLQETPQAPPVKPSDLQVVLEGVLTVPAVLDSGADTTVLGKNFFNLLIEKGIFLQIRNLKTPRVFTTASNTQLHSTQECILSITLKTLDNHITINNTSVFIIDSSLPEMLLGQSFLDFLGINVTDMIQDIILQEQGKVYDGSTILSSPTSSPSLKRVQYEESPLQCHDLTGKIAIPQKEDLFACEPEGFEDTPIGLHQDDILLETLKNVSTHLSEDISLEDRTTFKNLLLQYQDIFRLTLSNDDPAKVPPREITLIPDALPRRCTARRYPQAHMDFMDAHCSQLVQCGMLYENPNAFWCSNALVVPYSFSG